MRKTLIAPVIGLFMLVSTLIAVGPTAQTASAATTGCAENSIIYCGAHTTAELREKYKANTSGDLDNVYSHYGISATMINGAMKTGTLTTDGKVIVDGKTIATGAETVGRHYLSGSKTVTIGGKTYYQRSTTISLPRSSEIFVWVDADGKFISAIIKYCGNPVKATPVTPPAPAKAECVSLTAQKITRNEYVFTGTASTANGATISRHILTVTAADGTVQKFGLDTTNKVVSSGNVTLEDGVSTATWSVTTSVGARTSDACIVKVTVTPLPPEKVEVCNPATGLVITVNKADASKYKPVGDAACKTKVCNPATGLVITVDKAEADRFKPEGDAACAPKPKDEEPKVEGVSTIASTGPTDYLIGGAGLSTLTAAGYYWRASRQRLLGSILNR